jgi:LuxR family maltose regulon positive regulatory protein
MGEPAAAEAATSERDVLLATKLTVPGLRPDLVPRPRLAQRLDEGQGRGLVLACAPAGYGKTVLLAEWVRRGRHPVAWLSLDAGDNDPARFWRHAVAALDRVRPGISERMDPLLESHASPSFEPLMAALINEVADQPDADQALLLVLDDYHVISSQLVHDSLGFLLEHQPPGLHLALTSRSDPPLALARLRARGQLTELRAAELRFTPGEAAALLQQVAAAPGKPSTPLRTASPEGGPPAWRPGRPGKVTNSARFSSPRVGWTRSCGPASRRWKPRPAPARRCCRPQARPIRGWPRWPISATSSTGRSNT